MGLTMKRLLLFLVTIVLSLSGCANDFAKFYIDKGGGLTKETRDSRVEFYTGVPKYEQGRDADSDFIEMYKQGYGLLGYSGFRASNAKIEDAVSFGEKIGAERILLYSKYLGSTSGVNHYTITNPDRTVINQQNGTLNSTGTIYNPNYNSTYRSTGNYTGYSTQVIPGGTNTYNIPYTVHFNEYLATYYAKVNSVIGLLTTNISDDMQKQLGIYKGVLVIAVKYGSPANKAGIIKGDIITNINNQDIFSIQEFGKVVDANAKKEVSIHVIRDNRKLIYDIKLN